MFEPKQMMTAFRKRLPITRITETKATVAICNQAMHVSGLSSGEGVIWEVRDASFEQQRDKKTGELNEVKVDNGVDDKRLFVAESEFAQALKVMSRPANILSAVLRYAWDTGNLRTLIKNNPARATDAHITIVGHITEEELKRGTQSMRTIQRFCQSFPLARSAAISVAPRRWQNTSARFRQISD